MHIGIPTEIKPREGRVSLTPQACSSLVKAGHKVSIQQNAGVLSGFPDLAYEKAGVRIYPDARALYENAKLIVKVKEPVAGDLKYLRQDHLLFCFLHLAAEKSLLNNLLEIGLTAIAFETVQLENHSLPLLLPMSVIAGRLAAQVGMNLLHTSAGGKGVLLGGMASTERGQAVVLGAGNAGAQAIDVLAAIGTNVTVFDLDSVKLAALHKHYPNVTALVPTHAHIKQAVEAADLMVGAVLVPGKRAPVLVDEEMIASMQAGSAVIDIAVDQGGCIETIKPTTWEQPVYVEHGVIHFGVTNMPGTVPKTATQALSAAILPYVFELSNKNWQQNNALRNAVNVENGKIIHAALK
jgi:alanine dehydrogenase